MMKLPEIKKMIKNEINDNCLWMVKAELIIRRTTYATASVYIKLGYKELAIATFGLMNEKAELQEKNFKAVEKYAAKVENSLVNVEEMEIKVISDLRDEYEF